MNTEKQSNIATFHPRTSAYIRGSSPACDLTDAEKRNLRLSFLPANQFLPVDVSKYDQRIVLEALHNCIAHQDYTRCERILVIERQGELVFQNAGSFFVTANTC